MQPPLAGLIHHSDRGSQYASGDFRTLLTANGLRPSMSGKGNCFDNTPVESWFASLKVECADCVFATKSAARSALFEYIELFWTSPCNLDIEIRYTLPQPEYALHQIASGNVPLL
jgi:transposase InsO family protein